MRKQKEALLIERCYDDIQYHPEYIIKDKKDLNDLLSHIEQNTIAYCRARAHQDGLTRPTNMRLERGDFGKVPDKLDVPIVARVQYTYSTIFSAKPLGWFSKTAILLLILTIPSVYCTYSFFNNLAQRKTIQDMCYLFTINGKPEKIVINGEVIYYQPDGGINETVDPFTNPWIRDRINDPFNQCMIINNRR